MSWTLLLGLVLALCIALLAALTRRIELAGMERRLERRERARREGSEARFHHPVVDLSRCLGCGTCVAACPEDNVLELVHGQAVVVNGARCRGHAACERECPVGAISVTVADLEQRSDIPVLSDDLEAVGVEGLFLAGEVTAHALIKTAIEHGTAVADEVARRVAEAPDEGGGILDLVVVGAGPAGLACSLEAKRLGLRFVTLDQEAQPGGTVAKYPRKKLVVSEPVELPLHGRLGGLGARTTFEKEELVELWQAIARQHELPIQCGEVFQGIERASGWFLVRTQTGALAAKNVCLALGRRGTPRQLGVPGEDLPKVAYALLDARAHEGRRILIVGGGDSAVEAALGLAEQPGNQVTLSYRRESFFRLRARNEEHLQRAVEQGKLALLLRSEVRVIHEDRVDLEVRGEERVETIVLGNDEVFVLAGGTTPFELLERSGVSFDPARHKAPPGVAEQGTGLVRALAAAFVLALLALGWAVAHADYYMLPAEARPADPQHAFLRPGRGAGLAFGVVATALVVVNLLYLVRRSVGARFQLGSLQAWMTTHVATGILAVLCATLHAAMAPRDTVGGYGLGALALLLVTGAIGRYFYAAVPRAANGRELKLDELKERLRGLGVAGDPVLEGFATRARNEIGALIRSRQWRSSFLGRVKALLGGQRDINALVVRLRREARAEGIPEPQMRETLRLARAAHRTATAAAHYEDLRAVLASWRYLHRWIAVALVLLIGLHVAYSLTYGALFSGGGG